jgi:uncharacterized protein (TIGR03437 family)
MLTLLRLAPHRFKSFKTLALMAGLLGLGTFDTVQAQTLTVSATTLSFTAVQGSNPNPATQQVVTGGSGNFIISTNASWIFASTGAFNGNGGTAGETLTVQINSTSLSSGSYNGTITLTPTNGNAAVTITVNLTVSGSGGNTTSVLSASPSQLSFAYQLTKAAPASQTVQILSSGIALPFSFSTTTAPTLNCTQTWLQVTSGTNTTPGALTVSINTTGLSPGTCTGSISVTSSTQGNGTTTTQIGVTLFISSSALLNVNIPTGLSSVTLQQSGRPVQYVIGLTSSDPNVSVAWTATVPGNPPWLALSPSNGGTPGSINVQITPGTVIPVGTYSGSVVITSPGLFNNSLTIPITFKLNPSSTVTVSSTSVGFSELQGGSLPAPQTVTLSGSVSSVFTAAVTTSTGGTWLQVSPTSANLTANVDSTLTLSVLPNTLTPNTYQSQVTVTFQNSSIPSIVISVALTVGGPASALVPSPSTLAFSYQAGGTAPASQIVTITNPAAASVPFTVGSISDSWLSVTPSSGNTPANLAVSVAPQSLQTGSYNASFTLTSPGLASITVNVSLFVSASSTPQPFIIGNSASGVGVQLSPGEIITIKGSGLGPGNGVSFTVNAQGGVNSILAGVQVFFDGIPGTPIYVSSTQINVIVPYGIAGKTQTTIVVSYGGASSTGITQPVGPTSLGIFTNNATGSGQAAALNSNYTYNTATTPALQGSYVAVYATGGGQTIPGSVDGEVSPTATVLYLAAQSQVTATIGGKPATVLFAGAAPGYVTGVVQFNIQIPIGVSGSALPLVVSINGGTTSQTTSTLAVQ